jgi:Glycosyl hydrolases family 18
MSVRLRVVVLALLALVVAGGAIALTGGLDFSGARNPTAPPSTASASGAGPDASVDVVPKPPPTPTPVPALGGTELYGFLPYWQMNGTVATYLRSAPLTTVALFSVTARRNGSLNTGTTAYKRISGGIGRRLTDEAHALDRRVDLVFTSFGTDRNAQFFGRVIPPPPVPIPSLLPGASAATALPTMLPTPLTSPAVAPTPAVAPWHRTVTELVAAAKALGADGICVDIELLDELDRGAYGEFLIALRAALVAAIPGARLTVATEAGPRGVGNAAVASAAGVDRLFLMGYDYHWSSSSAGASSPVDRTDGVYTLRWSIDQYVDAGVPRDRILLGLPLYGMQWRTEGPHRIYPIIGAGVTWVPSQHRDLLDDPGFQPNRDRYEQVEWFVVPDGTNWLLTYFDSPATLRPKLALALDNGLAGAGFWAMGYERGLPGYVELMREFRDGTITRTEAPPRP